MKREGRQHRTSRWVEVSGAVFRVGKKGAELEEALGGVKQGHSGGKRSREERRRYAWSRLSSQVERMTN